MNKKTIITIIVVILIIVIAVFVGKKLSESKSTNTGINSESNTPVPTEDLKTPEVETTEEPIETPIPSATPTTKPEEIKDVTKMTSTEKEEYAKSIAKENWEKLGISKNVYYDFEQIESDGKYLVAIRDKTTTNAMKWCEVDIKTKKCEMFD